MQRGDRADAETNATSTRPASAHRRFGRLQSKPTHNHGPGIMQSVFSVALPQKESGREMGPAGDAALKMDWTKPLTTPNAMGIDSSVQMPGLAPGHGEMESWSV